MTFQLHPTILTRLIVHNISNPTKKFLRIINGQNVTLKVSLDLNNPEFRQEAEKQHGFTFAARDGHIELTGIPEGWYLDLPHSVENPLNRYADFSNGNCFVIHDSEGQPWGFLHLDKEFPVVPVEFYINHFQGEGAN